MTTPERERHSILNPETPAMMMAPHAYWLACARELVARDDLASIIVLAVDNEGKMNIALSTPPGEATQMIYDQMREFVR